MRSQATEPQAGVSTTAPGALNLAWADRFVAALAQAGVRHAVLCSGSRSAPLALALTRCAIATHVSLDERAAAYFALGQSKASRRPVLLVCTSGTAAANFFPAILEARYARVPLIVATADRPPELRDTGAAQTIDQIKLFGGAVRWFVEAGLPDPAPTMLEYAASLGTRAVAEARSEPAGPVHLNFAFREPLVPDPDSMPPLPPHIRAGITMDPAPEPLAPPPRSIERLAAAIRSLRRGIIACGPDEAASGFGEAIRRLSAMTGYPVLADPASQIRFGAAGRPSILGAYDSFLRSRVFSETHGPEIVIQLGAPLTSKSFHQYVERHRAASHVLVDPGGGWRAPARTARGIVRSDPLLFTEALGEALGSNTDPLPSWSHSFERAEEAARDIIESRLQGLDRLEEAAVIPALLHELSESGTLYVGNSMPVRDLDAFAPRHPRAVRVLANRGVNGIEGIVSSGLGASVDARGPVLVVTGDLSFHHDLNALHMALDERVNATVVVLHNDGGGIFSFLPIARHPEFQRLFATPHGLDFEPAAALYGVPHARPATIEDLRSEAARALAGGSTTLIQVKTDRERNRSFHQSVWEEVVGAVERGIST